MKNVVGEVSDNPPVKAENFVYQNHAFIRTFLYVEFSLFDINWARKKILRWGITSESTLELPEKMFLNSWIIAQFRKSVQMHSKTSHTSTIFDLRSLFIITKPFLEPSYDLLSYSPFTDHWYFLYYNSEFQNILGKAADTRAWSLRADLWFFLIWFSKGKRDWHTQNIHTVHQNPIYKA